MPTLTPISTVDGASSIGNGSPPRISLHGAGVTTIHGALDAAGASWVSSNFPASGATSYGSYAVRMSAPAGLVASDLILCGLRCKGALNDFNAGPVTYGYDSIQVLGTGTLYAPGGEVWAISVPAGAPSAIATPPTREMVAWAAPPEPTIVPPGAQFAVLTPGQAAALTVAAGYLGRVRDVEVVYNDLAIDYVIVHAPTVSASAVASGGPGNPPTVSWTSTAATQRQFDIRIYTQATTLLPGFDPASGAFPAVYAGSVARPAPTSPSPAVGPWNATSFTAPVSLQPGAYVAFVRVWADFQAANTIGAYQQPSLWSAGAPFTATAAYPGPAAPTIPTGVLTSLPNPERVTRSHIAGAQAVLFDAYGRNPVVLDLIDGEVSYSAAAKVRATVSFTVADVDLVPSGTVPLDPARPLHPFGPYVHVARSVGGDLVSLGVFRLDRVERASADSVKVTGSDWSAWLDDAAFTTSTTRQSWSGGTATPQLVTDVATAICTEAGCLITIPVASTVRVGLNYANKLGDNRLDALAGLADMLGWVTYATDIGRIYFGPGPTSADATFAVLTPGAPASLATSQTVVLDRKDVYDMLVIANQAGTIVASAFDSNPESPIAAQNASLTQPVFGRGAFAVGRKPKIVTADAIADQATMNAAALAAFARMARDFQPVPFTAIPRPDLRPGHIVETVLDGDPASTVTKLIVTDVRIPLTVDAAMTGTGIAVADFAAPHL